MIRLRYGAFSHPVAGCHGLMTQARPAQSAENPLSAQPPLTGRALGALVVLKGAGIPSNIKRAGGQSLVLLKGGRAQSLLIVTSRNQSPGTGRTPESIF